MIFTKLFFLFEKFYQNQKIWTLHLCSFRLSSLEKRVSVCLKYEAKLKIRNGFLLKLKLTRLHLHPCFLFPSANSDNSNLPTIFPLSVRQVEALPI